MRRCPRDLVAQSVSARDSDPTNPVVAGRFLCHGAISLSGCLCGAKGGGGGVGVGRGGGAVTMSVKRNCLAQMTRPSPRPSSVFLMAGFHMYELFD